MLLSLNSFWMSTMHICDEFGSFESRLRFSYFLIHTCKKKLSKTETTRSRSLFWCFHFFSDILLIIGFSGPVWEASDSWNGLKVPFSSVTWPCLLCSSPWWWSLPPWGEHRINRTWDNPSWLLQSTEHSRRSISSLLRACFHARAAMQMFETLSVCACAFIKS